MMDELPINITDLIIVAVVLCSSGLAVVRGFVHELLAVGAWIGATIATVFGLPHTLPYIRELIAVRIIADIVAGVCIFVMVLVVLSILTHFLARQVRASRLGAVDRSLGLPFGLLRGVFLVSLAWLFVLWLVPRNDLPPWITEARALPLVERSAQVILAALPEDLRPDLGDNAVMESNPALHIEQLFRPDITPETKIGEQSAGPAAESGYSDTERKDLQRLLDSTQ